MLQLLSSLIIVGVFSYFLAVLADHNEHAPEWLKAVAGIAGVAAIYAILTSFFILAYGGLLGFSRISMLFDGTFAVAFLAICLMTRHGALPCTGRVTTPVGSGDAEDPGAAFGDEDTGTGRGDNLTSMRYLATACKLEKGTFAVSIIGTLVFPHITCAPNLFANYISPQCSLSTLDSHPEGLRKPPTDF